MAEAAVAQAQAQRAFQVSWDQLHRDARALAWRLTSVGHFEAIVCITRGGLVPAGIVARELEIRLIRGVGSGCLAAKLFAAPKPAAMFHVSIRKRN